VSPENSLVCYACGSTTTEATVHLGSYVLRCSACGECIVATSFIAFADESQHFAAYRDPGHGKKPAESALIARGQLGQIHKAVRQIAERGDVVLLVLET
jgi:hypothetical protein